MSERVERPEFVDISYFGETVELVLSSPDGDEISRFLTPSEALVVADRLNTAAWEAKHGD